MILLGSTLANAPVVSLQTGGELARADRPIIDPKNLSIIAYELTGSNLVQHPTLLRIADVRELSDMGLIVDSSDEFIGIEDVIKIKDIYSLNFNLLGIAVVDEKKTKLGRVVDFTLDTNGFIVQQITVKRPFLRSLNDTELIIHRSQIIEINNKSVVVHSRAKAPAPERSQAIKSYVNPFRNTETSPEHIESNTQ